MVDVRAVYEHRHKLVFKETSRYIQEHCRDGLSEFVLEVRVRFTFVGRLSYKFSLLDCFLLRASTDGRYDYPT